MKRVFSMLRPPGHANLYYGVVGGGVDQEVYGQYAITQRGRADWVATNRSALPRVQSVLPHEIEASSLKAFQAIFDELTDKCRAHGSDDRSSNPKALSRVRWYYDAFGKLCRTAAVGGLHEAYYGSYTITKVGGGYVGKLGPDPHPAAKGILPQEVKARRFSDFEPLMNELTEKCMESDPRYADREDNPRSSGVSFTSLVIGAAIGAGAYRLIKRTAP